MSNNRIQLFGFNQINTIRFIPNRYEFNPSGKLKWLQRFCLWILKHLKAQARETISTLNRVEINLDDLTKAVFDNGINLRHFTTKKPHYLIIGHKQFAELAHGDNNFNYLQFQIPASYNALIAIDGIRQPRFFAGLQVVIVPWIDGMFVLPKIE